MPFVQAVEWKSLNMKGESESEILPEKNMLQPVDLFLFNSLFIQNTHQLFFTHVQFIFSIHYSWNCKDC